MLKIVPPNTIIKRGEDTSVGVRLGAEFIPILSVSCRFRERRVKVKLHASEDVAKSNVSFCKDPLSLVSLIVGSIIR